MGSWWESQTKSNWRLKQDTDHTRGEMSDKMKIAFQPVVGSKSSKCLLLPCLAERIGKGAIAKPDCSFTGV